MPEPYFHISQYNSIRFAEVVEWDFYNNPKTVPNTLSYQEDGVNEKDFCQLYQLDDAVRIQFKSSYPTNTVTVNGCDESTTSITPVKRTNNFDIIDVRVGNITQVGTTMVVYFEGSIPDWMITGSSIGVSWGIPPNETAINDIVFEIIWLDAFGVYGLRLTNYWAGGDIANVTVTTTYDKFEYNIYEFDVDFSQFSAGKYQIQIDASGITDEPDVCYKSEILLLKDAHENTYQFISEHDENTQINYSWGIQHMIRLGIESPMKFSPDGDKTIHKTDSNTLLLDSSNYENYEIELSPLPAGMAIKVSLFISLSTLFIASRSYVASANPSTERLGDSNLYDCKLSLILANDPFDNKMENFKNGVPSNRVFSSEFSTVFG